MKRIYIMLLCFAAFFVNDVNAVIVKDLYSVSVPVATQDPGDRNVAVQSALQTVSVMNMSPVLIFLRPIHTC